MGGKAMIIGLGIVAFMIGISLVSAARLKTERGY